MYHYPVSWAEQKIWPEVCLHHGNAVTGTRSVTALGDSPLKKMVTLGLFPVAGAVPMVLNHMVTVRQQFEIGQCDSCDTTHRKHHLILPLVVAAGLSPLLFLTIVTSTLGVTVVAAVAFLALSATLAAWVAMGRVATPQIRLLHGSEWLQIHRAHPFATAQMDSMLGNANPQHRVVVLPDRPQQVLHTQVFYPTPFS